MIESKKNIIIPTIFTIFAFTILISLGSWQIKRLFWKTELLKDINSRLSMSELDLNNLNELSAIDKEKYRKVKAEGVYLNDKEMHLYSGARNEGNKEGYLIITPFKMTNGKIILVERGWVPIDLVKTGKKSWHNENSHVIEGAILTGEKKTLFLPDNDLKNNLWFYIDIEAMRNYTGLDFPDVVIVHKRQDNETLPIGKNFTTINIRNDHLQYAIIWYSLAIISVVVYVIYLRKAVKG